MVEVTMICNKLIDLGQDGRFRIDYYRGFVKGLKGPKDAFIKSEFENYNAKIFKLYKSHTKHEGHIEGVDRKRIISVNVFSGLSFKIGLAALVLVIVVFVFGFIRTKDGINEMQEKSKVKQPQSEKIMVPPSNQLKQAIKPVPVKKELSERWRISGIYHIGFRRMVLLTDGSVSFRLDLEKNCKAYTELECAYNGELVTRYSGHMAPITMGGLSASASQNDVRLKR
jgi:hypothetical protein